MKNTVVFDKLRILALAVAVMLLAGMAPAYAQGEAEEILPYDGPRYLQFTGAVKEVRPYVLEDGAEDPSRLFVLLQGEDGQEITFFVDASTHIAEGASLETGNVLTGIYDGMLPAVLIYPPRHNAVALAQLSQGQSLFVGVFDEDMVSSDGFLMLSFLEGVQVVNPDGTPYEGELLGNLLAAYYTVSTGSIPAKTTPEKVVVLSDAPQDPIIWQETFPVVVNGQAVETPMPYEDENRTVMVAAEPIAEALGKEYVFDPSANAVRIEGDILFTIGEDAYLSGGQSISLGAPATLVGEDVYVPLSFFRDVMNLPSAFVFEAQVVIDENVIME